MKGKRNGKKQTKEELLQKEVEKLRQRIYLLEKGKELRLSSHEDIIFRSISENVMLQDVNGVILWGNKAAAASVNLTPEELIGKLCYDVFHGLKERCPFCPLIGTRQNGEISEGEVQSKNGRWWLIRGYPIKGKNGEVIGMIEIASDITERKKMEIEREWAHRMESIGILCRGIAHDFNNILTAVLGNISLAMQIANPQDEVYEKLIDAEKATLMLKNLTQQLMAISKGREPIKEVVSLKGLLIDACSFSLSGSSAKVKYSIPDDLWSIECDPGQISQVISNIAINANQSMQSGGEIEVAACNVKMPPKNSLSLPEGNYVMFSIKDGGVGIPEEILPKIFDPYFTTKKGGSGLGLTVAYSIVKKHCGAIKVESQVGKGTKVEVYLPSTGVIARTDGAQRQQPSKGCGRILVMDDEKIVQRTAATILKYCGYEVECVSSGEEMLSKYKLAMESHNPFDAVIMDLTVSGGMGAIEAIGHLLKIDPDAKAIISSGYIDNQVVINFKKYGFKSSISKPYGIEEIAEVLSNVINDKGQEKSKKD